MAELLQEQLDLNTAIVEAQDGSIEQSIIATPYFEDYLYKIFTDINAINDEISAAAVTDGANVGGFAEVFQEKDGTILEFRTLQSSDGSVALTQNADDIDLSVALNTADGTVANSLITWDGVDTWTELAELLLSWSAGVATLLVEDSLGANQIGLTIDGDGETGFFWDGVEVANTRAAAAGGMFVNNLLTGAGFERVLTTSDAGGGTTVNPGTALNTILTWDNVSAWNELSELTLGWVGGVLTMSVEDDLAALQPVFTADADAEANIFYNGVKKLATTDFGISIFSSLTAGVEAFIGFHDNVGVRDGFLQMGSAAGTCRLRNETNSQNVLIEGTGSSSVVHKLFEGAPDGVANVFYDGDHAFGSDSLGMVVYGVTDTQPRINFLDNEGGNQVGNIRATSTNFVVDNRVTSGLIKLRAVNSSVSVVECFSGDPDGLSVVNWDGINVLATASLGIRVLDSSGALPKITLESNAATLLADLLVDGSGNLIMGPSGTAAANTQLFSHNGVARSVNYATGNGLGRLFGNGSNTINPEFTLNNSSGVLLGRMGYIASTSLSLDNVQHGALVTLRGEDAGGTLRNLLVADPDTDVILYYAGTQELATKSGGALVSNELEIDGDLNHDGTNVGFYGTAPAAQSAAYTRNATIVESRTLLASASATALNNNNVLAALIADLQSIGILA